MGIELIESGIYMSEESSNLARKKKGTFQWKSQIDWYKRNAMFTEIVGCTQKNQEECRVQSMQTVADFELPRMAKRSSQKKVSWHNVQEVLGFMVGASGMRETKDHHQGYPNLTTSCDVKSPDFLEIPGWLISSHKEMRIPKAKFAPKWSHGRGPGVSGES